MSQLIIIGSVTLKDEVFQNSFFAEHLWVNVSAILPTLYKWPT